MAKVMLVEDDNNLREIYEARLVAEGYQIVSAPDGEAALALAIKEKPDLIISDIMMPKVSGFDMLDILRSTTETKNAKIIMMTALGQAEDKARAEQLGADRYLVKSQVTLEDVVKTAEELLGNQNPTSVGGIAVEQPAPIAPQASTPLSATPAPQAPEPVATPPVPAPAPPEPTAPQPAVIAPTTPVPAPVQAPVSTPSPSTPQSIPVTIADEPPVPAPAPAAPAEPAPAPEPVAAAPAPQAPASMAQPPSDGEKSLDDAARALNPDDTPSGEQIVAKSDAATPTPNVDAATPAGQRKKVINPISDVVGKGPDLDALLAKEGETLDGPLISKAEVPEESPALAPPTPLPEPVAATPTAAAPAEPASVPVIPDTSTTAEEEAALQDKIEQFITTQNPTITTSPISDVKPPETPTPAA